MNFKLLEKNELKKLSKLCPAGESWADVYYQKITLYHTGKIKTFAIEEEDRLVAELVVIDDDTLLVESFAKEFDTIQIFQHNVLKSKRNMGYGTAILKYVCFKYRDIGYKTAVVELPIESIALKYLYIKCGFVEVLGNISNKVLLMKDLSKGE